MIHHLLIATLLFAAQDEGTSEVVEPAAALPPSEFIFERGEELLSLRLQRDEKLTFRVEVDLGPIEASVGTVTMSTGVEPYRESVLFGGNGTSDKETAWMNIHAKGDYTLYSMDASIETRILPQEWPELTYRYTHEGTENRRRELLIGWKEGVRTSSYRRDTRKGAPKGTRIWKKSKERTIPVGSLDLLSAVYMVRTLIQEDLQEVSFPLLDKEMLWQMNLRRGQRKRIKTRAGTFDAVEIVLQPGVYPGEETEDEEREKFEGLFGLHGSIHLWVERNSGVPLRIEGDLPVGPLTLGIDVELKKYRGTPATFQKVE